MKESYKYIIWTGWISIHYSSFIRALSQFDNVLLVVSKHMCLGRLSQGWYVPNMGNASIIETSCVEEIELIIRDNPYAVHLMGYGGVQFKVALKMNSKILLMIESHPFNGIKGIKRMLKYAYIYLIYHKRIGGLLITGKLEHRKSGWPAHQLFDWAYFTEDRPNFIFKTHDASSHPACVFCGQLSVRKNIIPVIKIVIQNEHLCDHFLIIGDGELRNEVELLASRCSKIRFLSSMENREFRKILENYDLLILPSIEDGWGCVVNEALQAGCRVLVSETSGAQSLIKNHPQRGSVFNSAKSQNLEYELIRILQLGKVTTDDRKENQKWATENISGDVAAQYYKEICKYVFENKFTGSHPKAPWII